MEVCRWCSGYVRAGGVMVGVQGGWERGGTGCDAGTERAVGEAMRGDWRGEPTHWRVCGWVPRGE